MLRLHGKTHRFSFSSQERRRPSGEKISYNRPDKAKRLSPPTDADYFATRNFCLVRSFPDLHTMTVARLAIKTVVYRLQIFVQVSFFHHILLVRFSDPPSYDHLGRIRRLPKFIRGIKERVKPIPDVSRARADSLYPLVKAAAAAVGPPSA